ncbi:holin [Streptomyces sp. NPDC056401]|uniref:holin n=1 Tax=Streptomyces sp. NPDC056401 TaxID=3345809 RepID=UPI0035E0BCC2
MSEYLTRTFWIDAMERAIKTVAQTVLSVWLIGDVVFNLLAVDWGQTLGVAMGAGAISILMSLASAQTGDKNSASLVVETKELK